MLPRPLFDALLEHAPFRPFMFQLFSARLAELTELVEAVAFRRLDARLADPKLKAIVSAMWTYYGLPPSRLSSFYYAIPTIGYLQGGGYYPRGRSQTISNAFVRFIEQHGGKVLLETEAEKILVKDGAAYGVLDGNGKTYKSKVVVSNADARFLGKVVLVSITGSWCPNCHDEAAFLAQLYRDLRGEGLEVVSLQFEHFGDFAQAAAATRRFRDKFDIEYTTLIAGTSDRDEAAKALPQLTGVFAYPTTIWIDRTGTVRKIHAGFSGPATGEHYTTLKREFTEFTQQLLAE